MKKIIIILSIILPVLILRTQYLKAEINEIMLIGCDCEKWLNYEDGFVKSVEESYKENNWEFPDSDKQIVRSQATLNKRIYLMGLMDAYGFMYELFKDKDSKNSEVFKLPFNLGQYIEGINNYCSVEDNKNKFISAAILLLNTKLKEKQ